MLFKNDWSEDDATVLTELGEQIGIDLIAYWPW